MKAFSIRKSEPKFGMVLIKTSRRLSLTISAVLWPLSFSSAQKIPTVDFDPPVLLQKVDREKEERDKRRREEQRNLDQAIKKVNLGPQPITAEKANELKTLKDASIGLGAVADGLDTRAVKLLIDIK